MSTTSIEVFLFCLNCAVWLGPLFLAARRGIIALIHPSGFLPIYLIFTVSISMTEHWFGWSLRSAYGALRLETKYYEYLPSFFVVPLTILFFVGVAYYFGVHKGCGRIIAAEVDRVHLTQGFRSVKAPTITVILATLIVSFLSVAPFILFGQDKGFFWTLGLLNAFSLIPVLIMGQWRAAGYLAWFLGLPVMLLLDSKANFIYYILPVLLFYQGSLLYRNSKFKLRRLIFLLVMVVIVAYGTRYLTIRRGEYLQDLPLIYNIMVREYGFEVFGILVNKISPFGQVMKESWIFLELKEIVPSVLLPGIKVRTGVRVAEVFLPADYAYAKDVGFNRFLVFAAYHDFGWIGAIACGFVYGWLFGKLYGIALKRARRDHVLWPLIAWLPIPVYSQYFATGSISFAVVFSIFGAWIVYCFRQITRLRVVYRPPEGNYISHPESKVRAI